ncbi:MAG: ABC transporter permease subunit [Deltaproteobacteria bacterium]|nr:ABC transporter permease subunit [Deltaproteobacteria bacterium]
MSNFWPVFKREIKVYFTSPIAYAVSVIFLIIAGYFFYSSVAYYVLVSYQTARNPMMEGLNLIDLVLTPMFGNISVVMLLMLPLLTMRLFAEEKKTGTYELLLSYPIKDLEVLLGKYLAALTVFAFMIALTGFYHLLLWGMGVGDFGVVMAGYLGIFLLGAAFLALGVFISSLTENQIVAAAISFGVLLLFWVVSWSSSSMGPPWSELLDYLALVKHILNFAKGIIDTADVVYYLLFVFFFLFLTLRSLETKRWRA